MQPVPTYASYQPASGFASPLNADLLDPLSSASGIFGGEVLAPRFNIDFNDAGLTGSQPGIVFGNLTLCNLPAATSGFNGQSIRTFQAEANNAVGGGVTPYAIDDLNQLAVDINASFADGAASLFAQAHIVNGTCPP